MIYFLVDYEFEIKTINGCFVKLNCVEIMTEQQRHHALEYIKDSNVYCIRVDVGYDDIEEILINIDEVKDTIKNAKEIREEDYKSFQRMFEDTKYGQLRWKDLEALIDEERDFKNEEGEWDVAI